MSHDHPRSGIMKLKRAPTAGPHSLNLKGPVMAHDALWTRTCNRLSAPMLPNGSPQAARSSAETRDHRAGNPYSGFGFQALLFWLPQVANARPRRRGDFSSSSPASPLLLSLARAVSPLLGSSCGLADSGRHRHTPTLKKRDLEPGGLCAP